MHDIKLTKITDSYTLCRPEKNKKLDVDSAVTEVVTSFRDFEPLMLESGVTISQAQKIMQKAHVKLKIVIDKNERMIGAISFADLIGEKALLAVKSYGCRDNVLVSYLMTPLVGLKAICSAELNLSSIKDILHLLKDEHIQHVFIVDKEAEQITGVISASDITRKLRIPLKIDDSPTFHSIFNTL